MVQGRILMEDRRMTELNEETIIRNAEWAFSQMEERLKASVGGDAEGEGIQMTK